MSLVFIVGLFIGTALEYYYARWCVRTGRWVRIEEERCIHYTSCSCGKELKVAEMIYACEGSEFCSRECAKRWARA